MHFPFTLVPKKNVHSIFRELLYQINNIGSTINKCYFTIPCSFSLLFYYTILLIFLTLPIISYFYNHIHCPYIKILLVLFGMFASENQGQMELIMYIKRFILLYSLESLLLLCRIVFILFLSHVLDTFILH